MIDDDDDDYDDNDDDDDDDDDDDNASTDADDAGADAAVGGGDDDKTMEFNDGNDEKSERINNPFGLDDTLNVIHSIIWPKLVSFHKILLHGILEREEDEGDLEVFLRSMKSALMNMVMKKTH